MEYKFFETPLYTSDSLTLQAEDSKLITALRIKGDNFALKFVLNFETTPLLTLSSYKPKLFLEVRIKYLNDEFFTSITSVIDGCKEYIVPLTGEDFSDLQVLFHNKTASVITFESFTMYKSEDLSPTQLVEVMKVPSIRSDVIHSTSVFADSNFVQLLQTNAMSRSVITASPGDTVEYIQAEGYTLGFYLATLGTEQEQFSITTTTSGVPVTHRYWWAVIEGDGAFKELTTVDPRTIYPDISESDRDAFRFMVYKPEVCVKKLGIEFAMTSDGNGGKTASPVILLGSGSSSDPNSLNGKGSIFKDGNGMYLKYTTQNGQDVGLIMDETGVYLKGVQNSLEYCTERDDGFDIKYKGDPEFSLIEVRDDAHNFLGFEVQGVLIPLNKKSGNAGS